MKKLFKSLLVLVFARQVRTLLKKHHPKVVAVAGSVGKTSTKMAIVTVLAEKYRIMYQAGNYNDILSVSLVHFGLPMPELTSPMAWARSYFKTRAIIKSNFPYDVIVLELGTDGPGQLIEFKRYVKADIGVLTAISEEHMEFFGGIENVAKEEFELSKLSKMMLINSDDVDPGYIQVYSPAALTTSFKTQDADFIGKLTPQKTSTKLDIKSLKLKISVEVASVAQHSAQAHLLAGAVGLLTEMDAMQISSGLAKITPFAGRMAMLKGLDGSVLIDDTYNASPKAVLAALDALYAMPANRRIAILGSMNELGDSSPGSHSLIGTYCNPKKLDLVITIGKMAELYTAPAALAKGCKVKSFASPYAAGEYVKSQIVKGTVILAKGSQNGVFAEEAVKILLADPADSSQLVRQSSDWQTKKRAQFSDAPLV